MELGPLQEACENGMTGLTVIRVQRTQGASEADSGFGKYEWCSGSQRAKDRRTVADVYEMRIRNVVHRHSNG